VHAESLTPAFLVLHSHRIERLLDEVAGFIQDRPLGPLEPEYFLVQSNGTAEWLKMSLAQHHGICAAAQLQLPGQFQWWLYRKVLGVGAVPERSPLDKATLAWRLMDALAELQPGADLDPAFGPLANYLRSNDVVRRYQLARRVADLYDQYQVHRPDWLERWAEGEAVLFDARGQATALDSTQQWQASLWQKLLGTLGPDELSLIRPHVHDRVVHELVARPVGAQHNRLPRRVVVFGLTHLPSPTLRLLAALSRHSQVVLAVPNPCQYHWADIIEGSNWLRARNRRHRYREGFDWSKTALEMLQPMGHPLLAAWGRQSRDFIGLLEEFDDAERTRARFHEVRIDLFEDDESDPPALPLLAQVQRYIRDLVPLADHPRTPVPDTDRSIVFHIAHSAVRELEILHDTLLSLLANPPPGAPLRPRDIIVMVPDIDRFAPAIRAIFGQYPDNDARHIPFDITDLSARGSSALLASLQWLLRIQDERCSLSELCALFEVPAIAARFGVEREALPRLSRWMQNAGIRWGLDANQRAGLGLGASGEINTALFGLRRMLLGYAVGSHRPASGEAFDDIEPFDEIGGLEAELVGAVAGLVEALRAWIESSSTPATPDDWAIRFRALLAQIMKAQQDQERANITALEFALERWTGDCAAAGYAAPLPLAVAAQAWLDALDAPSLGRPFRARGVTFCTLVPMRAVPFEMVCLLGMNDGDFPRRSPRADFDLIALPQQRRPGDRARRDDDRQLMLEALLSARRVLHVSWSGRSVRDDSPQPPSVLVSQLIDYLKAGWSEATVAARTTTHPLQPFSRRYFEAESPLKTHAREWRRIYEPATPVESTSLAMKPLARRAPPAVLTASQLARTLRNPARVYFQEQLGVMLGEHDESLPNEEAFGLDALDRYRWVDDISTKVLAQMAPLTQPDLSTFDIAGAVTAQLDRLRRSGALPFGGPGHAADDGLRDRVEPMLSAWRDTRLAFSKPVDRVGLSAECLGLRIEGLVDQRYASNDPSAASIRLLTLPVDVLKGTSRRSDVSPHRLIAAWVDALLAGTCGHAEPTTLIARDAVVHITPIAPDTALAQLGELVRFHTQALAEPLPVAPKTALAFVAAKGDPYDAAATVYEGDTFVHGEVKDAVLARCFPDFEALSQDGRFEALARDLYGALAQWVATQVTAHGHVRTADSAPRGASDDPA
jgi:exodeoxyribonuclease V gamma subunit